jgi:hypothetical protein
MLDNILTHDDHRSPLYMRTTANGDVHTPHHISENIKIQFRDDFAGAALDPDKWELIATGPGMAISFPGGTTSYLNINSGVDVDSETIIRSRDVFQLPMRSSCSVTASQRIANSEFFVEFIECDAAGVPITSAANQTNAGTSPDYAAIKFDGTSATSALVVVRGGGAPEFVPAASTITTTLAGGTSPNFTPANMLEMLVGGDYVQLNSSAIDSTSVATTPRRVTQSAPAPRAFYRLQIRAHNLSTAPASATDYRLHFIRLQSWAPLAAEIVGGNGNVSGAGSIGATIVGTPTVTANVAGASAEDAAVSGNAVRAGGRARTSPPTTFVAGDGVDHTMTTAGQLLTKQGGLPEQMWNANLNITSATPIAAVLAAGANLKNNLTKCRMTNTGIALDFIILDGATERYRVPLAVGQSVDEVFELDRLIATANTALNVALSAAGSVRFTAQGHAAFN